MSAETLVVTLSEGGRTTVLAYRSDEARRIGATLVLGHGAGAPQQSAFMVDFARALAARGVDVVTFNFLYTEQKRRVPDRAPVLEACYRAVVASARDHAPLQGNAMFIGGKSMGGRIATYLAAAAGEDRALRIPSPESRIPLNGVILLGYPLHPPGRPEQRRDAHLPDIRVPMPFVQGERDTFGTPDELRPILDRLKADVTLHVVERGDHSLAPSKRQEVIASTYADVQNVMASWIRTRA